MRLLLTSDGLTTGSLADFVIEKLPHRESLRACVVATRQRPEYQVYIDHAADVLRKLGFSVDVVNISEDIDARSLPAYDVYYSCGGNTFYILDRMRKTGMDGVLISAIKRNALYIGVSAGSIIVGPNIAIAGWGSGVDSNEYALSDVRGFNCVPYAIYPHYTPDREGELHSFQAQYGEHIPVVALTDEQAMYIDDTHATILGSTGGLVLSHQPILHS